MKRRRLVHPLKPSLASAKLGRVLPCGAPQGEEPPPPHCFAMGAVGHPKTHPLVDACICPKWGTPPLRGGLSPFGTPKNPKALQKEKTKGEKGAKN
jgi:hypothetical protein